MWQWGGFRGSLGWISCLPQWEIKETCLHYPMYVVTSLSAVRFLSCHRDVASLTHLTLIRNNLGKAVKSCLLQNVTGICQEI